VEKLRGLVRGDIADLRAILRWNAERGISLFRMGQDLIPSASHPAFPYDWEVEHGEELRGVGELARDLGIPAVADAFHHDLNPGYLTLEETLDVALPTWEPRVGRPKLHLSSQDADKRPGAHAYSVDRRDWQALLAALDGTDADVMVEAKGKESALASLSVKIE
jgi:UV DNA damage repair endonuclease